MRCVAIEVKTDGAGAADVVSHRPISGEIVEVRCPDAALNNAAKADFTVTRRDDGGAIVSVANADGPWSRSPRQPTHDTAGATALYAAGGTGVLGPVPVDGYVRVQIAEAAANATGKILVYHRR